MGEPVGIILAVPGLVNLAIIYASFLKEKYELYKEMDSDRRLYKLVSKCVDGEVFEVLMFCQENANTVTAAFLDDLEDLFQTIRDCRDSVVSLLTDRASGSLVKVGYSMHGARKLSKRCDTLEIWIRRFLDRAIVFRLFGMPISVEGKKPISPQPIGTYNRLASIRSTTVSTSDIDELKDLLLDEDEDMTEVQRVDASNVFILQSGIGEHSLAEYRTYANSSDVAALNAIRLVVRDIAARLRQADPQLTGILKCLGYSQLPRKNRFALHFSYPENQSNPRSLQSLLTDERNKTFGLVHSLSDRVRLARGLVSAVFYTHAGGFVHKKINPMNVIVFESASGSFPHHIGHPYLAGFDAVRRADAGSFRLSTEDWQQNIYLPPDRHRLEPGDEFKMQHDIYGLGVVLLEIACWGSFTDRTGLGRYLWEGEKKEEKSEEGEEKTTEKVLLDPARLKKQYLKLAKRRIPPTLGDKYRDVVLSCLEGLKDEAGLEHENGSSVNTGLAYIDQVMERLYEIEL
jgi:hypothetical protein